MKTIVKRAPEAKPKREKWPKVRRVTHKNGTPAWMVDARILGKGERYFYPTAVEADTKAEVLRIGRRNEGSEGMALPPRLRMEAIDCAQRLTAVGATISEATQFFLQHARPAHGSVTIEQLVEKFLRTKKANGCRAEYLRVQGHVLGKFAKHFTGRGAHTVGKHEIVEWFDAQPWALRTRNNYRTDISNLFGFALREGHCGANPLATMDEVLYDDPEIGILTVEEASNLLKAAEEHEKGTLLPYVAIALFAGLRTSELRQLDWAQVSITERSIIVLSSTAKGRARRSVTMSENLSQWLEPHATEAGAVVPSKGFASLWRHVRNVADLSKWKKNAMRHSFGSYHVAHHKNAPATSFEMGHDNPEQLFQSYRQLVSPAAAAKFWALAPIPAEVVK